MLKHEFTQEQMNELLLCVIQAEHRLSHLKRGNKPPQSEEESVQEFFTLFYNVRLRMYAIAPNSPRIELVAISSFFERGLHCKLPYVYFRW